jgi:hypothetical protein
MIFFKRYYRIGDSKIVHFITGSFFGAETVCHYSKRSLNENGEHTGNWKFLKRKNPKDRVCDECQRRYAKEKKR